MEPSVAKSIKKASKSIIKVSTKCQKKVFKQFLVESFKAFKMSFVLRSHKLKGLTTNYITVVMPSLS